jgi:hypothetical protein
MSNSQNTNVRLETMLEQSTLIINDYEQQIK